VPAKKTKKAGKHAKSKDAGEDAGEEADDAEAELEEGPSDNAHEGQAASALVGAGPRPQKKRSQAQRNAICFRYFRGSCKFDDCKFQHVAPERVTPEEQAQVLRELPMRDFDQKLAEVVQKMNIPRCKDFHQRGGCRRPDGRCHFWHLTDAVVARWAGFGFWCEACSKGNTLTLWNSV